MKCGECRYCDPAGEELWCRRNAPIAYTPTINSIATLMLNIFRHLRKCPPLEDFTEQGFRISVNWPIVEENDWCGDFQPKHR